MARKSRAQLQNERRAKYVQGWRDLGIHDKIISQFDLRNKNPEKAKNQNTEFFSTVKTQSRVYKTRETKQANAERRYNQLINHGVQPGDIKKKWLTSDVFMYEAMGRTNPNKVFTAKFHLALAFTPVNGNTSILDTSEYKKYTFEEIKVMLHDRIAEAMNDPQTSDDLVCVFQMFSGSESACDNMLDRFSKRGYDLTVKKLTDRRYYRLVNRNDWTMREYAEMMLCVINQTKNELVPGLVEEFRDFVEQNDLPFLELFY